MVETDLLTDTQRPGWYVAEDATTLSTGAFRWRVAARLHSWRPPTDVYETEETIVVRIEIAGMQEEDFSISLDERSLVIRGLRPDTAERRAYHQMEIFFGEFVTEIELPCEVTREKITADYSAGFLRVTMPKERPLKIQIKESDLTA